jgi:hypothetical protein
MGRGKLLDDVAAAILGSFVSRNNDVDGYWALGLLRSLADATGVSEFRLDVLRGETEPGAPLPQLLSQEYHGALQRHLAVRRIQPARIVEAEIIVTFKCDQEGMARYTSYGDGAGGPRAVG